jgi:hypothetical protein
LKEEEEQKNADKIGAIKEGAEANAKATAEQSEE